MLVYSLRHKVPGQKRSQVIKLKRVFKRQEIIKKLNFFLHHNFKNLSEIVADIYLFFS
jgi:hypothetical protein